MPVKIRLARRGRKKKPYYHIVVADARSPRDGKFIESIGFYNPMTVPASIEVDRDKAYEWLVKGAQPTNTAKAILRFKGVYYKKHLMRGVAKGALTEEKAAELLEEWINAKDAKIAARIEETKLKKAEFWKMVSGEIKPVKQKASKEAGDAFRETAATEEAPADGATAEAAVTTEATPEAVAEAEKAPEVVAEAKVEAKPTEKAPEAVVEAKVEAPAVVEEKSEPKPAVEAPVVETPAAEVKETVKEEVLAAAAVPVAAAAAVVTDKKADDLTKIEGVGPAISKLLVAQGIISFADLAGKSADDVKKILADAGGNFSMHDPTTWAKQAQMAADGKWDELKKWQDELDGGKETKASSEEE